MEADLNEVRWKILYRIGGIAAFTALLVMVSEIFLTALPEGSRTTAGISTISEWFDLFEKNWFMGMRNLGLINMIATTLTIPTFLALYGVHRKDNKVFSILALFLFLAGLCIFMADNTAFPMLALSQKYSAATTQAEKTLFAAAGEALLVRGRSHTPGTFPGFFFTEMASITISLVILKSKVFAKAAGITGLIAFGFLFIFEILSSFIPSIFNIAMIFAMIGGISAIVWYFMLGLGLLQAGKKEN